ncbi:hypothetical protein FHS60_000374 [Alloprevotella rava]|uniref:Uncharacterized protein n=1 Tax=Alloprevotella rava TaxID=671218 RepID=A0A7W5UIA7_9BACT|nr:hypothetical protein [Alloprevotella rava]
MKFFRDNYLSYARLYKTLSSLPYHLNKNAPTTEVVSAFNV